jgi:hypothetical protein
MSTLQVSQRFVLSMVLLVLPACAFVTHASAQPQASIDSVWADDSETAPQKPQMRSYDYAGWLAASYALMPVVLIPTLVNINENPSFAYVAMGTVLVPPLTHLVNGQPALAGYALLGTIGLTLGGGLVLGVVGYCVGSAFADDPSSYDGEEEESWLPVIGAFGGAVFGAISGWTTWAVMDVVDTHRRASAAKSRNTASLNLGFAPMRDGAMGALSGTF